MADKEEVLLNWLSYVNFMSSRNWKIKFIFQNQSFQSTSQTPTILQQTRSFPNVKEILFPLRGRLSYAQTPWSKNQLLRDSPDILVFRRTSCPEHLKDPLFRVQARLRGLVGTFDQQDKSEQVIEAWCLQDNH